jgi:hypothetical protein
LLTFPFAEIHGVNVIQKILASTALDAVDKAPLIENTKRVLLALNVSSTAAYRRILEVRPPFERGFLTARTNRSLISFSLSQDVGLPYTAPPPNNGLYRQNGRQTGQYPNGFNPYGLNLPVSLAALFLLRLPSKRRADPPSSYQMTYDPSIVNGLAGMSLSGDSWALPNGLSPLLVQNGQFGQFGNGPGEYGLVTPTFSPTSGKVFPLLPSIPWTRS